MSNVLRRFATKEPTTCAVCRRHAVWLGYHEVWRGPIIWLCDDGDCHAVARKVYAMPQKQLDAYERCALLEAGNAGGEYLDALRATDLAKLTPEEWHEFLRIVLTTFETTMRRKILNNEAPF
jgi:hypothetical protein